MGADRETTVRSFDYYASVWDRFSDLAADVRQRPKSSACWQMGDRVRDKRGIEAPSVHGRQWPYRRNATGKRPRPFELEPVAERLVAAGFRVVLPEPRGYGESIGPLSDVTMSDLAADVAQAVEKVGGAPVVVAGHAFGNRVGRMLAQERPDLVRAVVLIAGGGKFPPATTEIRCRKQREIADATTGVHRNGDRRRGGMADCDASAAAGHSGCWISRPGLARIGRKWLGKNDRCGCCIRMMLAKWCRTLRRRGS
jgi:pimeloyl-ACP methyl ester carboxylesterase